MKKIYILVISFFVLNFSYSQYLFYPENMSIDSLKKVLPTVSDSQKVVIYIKLNEILNADTFNADTIYFGNALKIAKKLNDTTLIKQVLYSQGLIYNLNRMPSNALIIAHKIIKYSNQNDIDWYLMKSYRLAGGAYFNVGDQDNSLRYLYKFLESAEKLEIQFDIAMALNNISVIYLNLNKLDKCLLLFKQAVTIADKIDIKTLSSVHDLVNISNIYNNIGVTYTRKKLFDQALPFYLKALKMRENIVEHNEYATSLNNIGVVYAEKGNYQEALEYYHKAIKIVQKNKKRSSEATYAINIADAYAMLNNYKLFQKYKDLAFSIAIELNSNNVYHVLYETMYDTYKKTGNFKKSLEYYELSIKYKNLLEEGFVQKTMEVLQARYNTSIKQKELLEKEKENAVLSQKEKNQRLLKNIAFLGIFISVFCLLLIYNRFKLRRKLLKEENAKIEIETNLKEQKNLLLEEKIKKDLELNTLKQNQLEEKVAHRERELATSTLYISQRNEMLENIRKMIEKILPYANVRTKSKLREINRTIANNIELREDWNTFKIHFENVHPDFFVTLKNAFPVLTKNDLKLCAYIKINLSNKEVQQLLNITISGMKTARNRLKKKLNLMPKDNLNEFVNDFKV